MRAAFLAVAVTLAAPAAQAAELPFPELAPTPEPIVEPGHWTGEPARPFVSLRLDLGYLYAKPRFSFGYGKPFSVWGGLDLVPFATPDSAGGYSGLRMQLGWFELRAGARFVHSFSRQYLTPKASYDLLDLAENTGRPANYVGLEAEASAAIPAGPGNILALFTASSVQLVPAGAYVYDETLRVVISPPPVYRGRLGYSLIVGKEGIARIGLVGEVIEIPDRAAQVYRAGFIGSFDIDDHLQLIATVLVPVYGPDSLGLLGADYTELGIRYRWASGHAHVPHERIPEASP
ncbi:MAG TPA: hypothetical protein VGH28_01435 [Polyangiaceae bacterium]|jgi:hypothetical protein